MGRLSRPGTFAVAALATTLVSVTSLPQTPRASPVAGTAQFAFYSDFATNLNDALITAGTARRAGEPELFLSGSEQACFAGLPAAERAGWSRAVDYYTEIVAPAAWFDRARMTLRIALMEGTTEWAEGEEHRYIEIATGLRAAAAPAYERCRWPTQDAANRRWIDSVLPLLADHEATIAERLSMVYDESWTSLPFSVDVVETAGWSGANSIILRPPGAHILVSCSNGANQDRAALEVVFHEASHFLARGGSRLRTAIDRALTEHGIRPPGDLWHAALFFTTGDVVRRAFEAAGEPAYEPYMYANDVFGEFHAALERTWRPYLAGERTLDEAADELVMELGAAAAR